MVSTVLEAGNSTTMPVQRPHKLTCRRSPNLHTHTHTQWGKLWVAVGTGGDLDCSVARGRDNVSVVKVDHIDGCPVPHQDPPQHYVVRRTHVPHRNGPVLVCVMCV